MLAPHTVNIESEVLQKAAMPETELLRSFLLLEAAGIMQYRDMSEPHPYVLHGEGTIITPEATGPNSRLVDRGGPLDDLRIFGSHYLEETPDNEIDAEYIKEQSIKVNATSEPQTRQFKSPLRLLDVLIVKTEILRDTLDSITFKQYGCDKPIGSCEGEESDAFDRVIDVMANVSGEKVGSVWFAGSSNDPEVVYATHVVRESPMESITIKNPYRNTEGAHYTANNNLNEFVLPAGKEKVTLTCRNSTLQADLVRQTAEINMVSYALLPPVPVVEELEDDLLD